MNLNRIASELSSLPQVIVESTHADRLLVHAGNRSIPLQVVMRASGYPRDVREAVLSARTRTKTCDMLLVSAPALTVSSREWLRQEGIAYIDEQGNLFLTADGIYIFREFAAKQHTSRPSVEPNIYRGRATQVLHALLGMPERSWHVTDLATEAGVAPGTALKVCETLAKLLLMEREGRGPQSLRRLIAPGTLLDGWAERHRLDLYDIHRYYRWMPDLDALASTIGAAVEQQGGAYAVTLSLAAMHRAPFLTQSDQIALLISESVNREQIATDCRLKIADEGPNVLLLSTRTAGPLMYRQKLDDLWIASDIQLYLDLIVSPGRGREQAEHLRRERIGF